MKFKVKDGIVNEDGIKGLHFYQLDNVFYHHIDELTLNLIDVAEAHNAQYDGWETSALVM